MTERKMDGMGHFLLLSIITRKPSRMRKDKMNLETEWWKRQERDGRVKIYIKMKKDARGACNLCSHSVIKQMETQEHVEDISKK